MSDAERYAQAKDLFLAARELSGAERTAFLDRECADDPDLRAEVESLLKYDSPETILSDATLAETDVFEGGSKEGKSLHPAHRWRSGESAAAATTVALFGTKRRLLVGAVLAILLLTALGIWTHHGVTRELEKLRGEELTGILNAKVKALEIWINDEKRDARFWAQQPQLRRDVEQLAQTAVGAQDGKAIADAIQTSPATKSLSSLLQKYLDEKGSFGYLITDRAGLVLASSENYTVGEHLTSPESAFNALVFEGKTTFAKPAGWTGTAERFSGEQPRDPPEIDPDARRHEGVPLIWVNTPVYNDRDEVIAALFFGMRSDDQFGKILSVSRTGNTGETYAFDEKGRMISESRFTDTLKRIGLIDDKPDARSALVVQVRDPGVDLTRVPKFDLTKLPARPLTVMAANAIAGANGSDTAGSNTDGYRDYRGVRVIGAWRWLPEYDFGVTTELDASEAFAPLWYLDMFFVVLFGPLAIALLGFLYSSYRVARLKHEVGEARRLGQYTLEDRIGEGGMGEVYRAQHAMLRRPTAVKLLKPEKTTDDMIARFEREVQLASQLTHPNTIAIFDYGRTPDGVFYYAMEYIGVTLRQLVNQDGPASPADAIHILRQICGSLREAHQMGLIHRDIKPQNIMLCTRGGEPNVVKVLDFGLAKEIESTATSEITSPAVVSGTPLYIPPERLQTPNAGDARSDLYGLGAVAYNLVTGHDTFECTNNMDLFHHILNSDPVRPSEHLDAPLPPKLEDLILACLARNPDDRPQSAQEVIDTLDSMEKS